MFVYVHVYVYVYVCIYIYIYIYLYIYVTYIGAQRARESGGFVRVYGKPTVGCRHALRQQVAQGLIH